VKALPLASALPIHLRWAKQNEELGGGKKEKTMPWQSSREKQGGDNWVKDIDCHEEDGLECLKQSIKIDH